MRVLFALFFGLALSAQTPTATLTGVVHDSSGAIVPGATVTVSPSGSRAERRVQANESGSFVITNLAPGAYDVTVEHAGFRRLHQKGLVLQVAQAARIEPKLEVGQVVETVEVTAVAPLLNTENQAKGEVITNQELVEMPLLNRDFSSLAFLVPGVSRSAESGAGGAFAVSGARPENTSFLVDGFSAQNHRDGGATATPPLEAMQEFKMQTSNYSAEFGRLAGGVMNMALKTGSNALHGSAFEFVRNDAFDARNFFDVNKSKLRRNQFGVNVTGPVWIPRLYNGRDRTFFVVSWDALRQRTGAPRLGRVPEDLERVGDFTGTRDAQGRAVTVKDPLSNVNYPGNRIPASQFHVAGKAMMEYYPKANRPGQSNNYYSNKPATGDSNSILAKIDQKVFAQDTLSVRIVRSYNPGTNPYFGGNLGVFGSHSQVNRTVTGATYTRLFRPTLINEARFGVSRFAREEMNDDMGRDFHKELGIPGGPQDPSQWGFPRAVVTNLLPLGGQPNPPVRIAVNTYEAADTLTWVKGRHVVKAGASLQRLQNFQAATNNNVRGTLNFVGRLTNHPIGDFLLGMLESSTLQSGRVTGYMLSTSWGFFLQDDFKVLPNLTLNLGARWEVLKPPHEKYGRLGSFIPELGRIIISDNRNVPNYASRIAQAGLQGRVGLASDYGVPDALVDSQNRNIGPRVGFAWRPSGRFVVRGGYGIFYGASISEATRSDMTTNFPLTVNTSFQRVATDPRALTLSDPFPQARVRLDAVTTAYGMQWHAPPQYIQNWNFTIERALTSSTAFEAGYVGSKGTNLSRKYDPNQPLRDPKARLANGTFPRPFSSLATIGYYSFDANSSFNSLSVSLRQTPRSGFFYRLGYVYGKSIDDASQVWGNSKGGYPGVQDSRNFSLERGRSDFDNGHSFTLAFSYEVPSRFHRLVRGWQVSSTGRMYTGQPFTVRVSGVNLDLGEANRPDRIAKGRLETGSANRWFDLTAFVPVARDSFRMGNSGRNILDGPGMFDLSLSVAKRFRLWEGHSLQFRGEAFNAVNRTNLMLPENLVNSPNVATIIQASPARVMQLGLRYQF